MSKPFVPFKPEEKVKVEITAREAHLLKCLRACSFGKVVVHKIDGVLVRVESSESVLLSEDEGKKAIEELL